MGNNWIKKQKREKFYKQAHKEGLRSRAAYKLRQIQAKYRILNDAKLVLDLCCAPGSWIQEIKRNYEDVAILGIDLVKIKPIEGTLFIQGDIRDENFIKNLGETLKRDVDVIISDCAPKITGIKETDYSRQLFLVESVLKIASFYLMKGGHLVCKLFDGDYTPKIRSQLELSFEKVDLFKPEASKKKSAELYLIGRNYNKTILTLNL